MPESFGPGSTALVGIGSLVTNDVTAGEGPLGILRDAAIVVEDGRVAWVGESADCGATDHVVDLEGRAVLPGFVDSHAHLVFAGDRADEFAARMAGEAYAAGGIRSTVARTRAASDDDLRSGLARLSGELHRSGVTTFETKSGYGLTTVDEARALRLAREVTEETTYLGAHVVPAEFADDPDGYVALVTGEMLDACAPHARWIDVFCDRGAFGADQAREILAAGIARGLEPRVHANQLQHGDGIAVAVEMGAASADHCTFTTDVTSTCSPAAAPWRPCCPGPSSPRGRPTPMPDGCSTPASRWRWRPTAIPARATPRACRSASPSPFARCTCRPTRRCGPPPREGRRPPSITTSDG